MSTDITGVDPRVLVLQVGARLHYGVPAVYARANALHALYTDACASLGVLSVARRLVPARYRNATLRRLLGRTLPPDVDPKLVRVETFATLTERLRLQVVGSQNALVSTHERLRRRVLREKFAGANCLYCLSNSDLELMSAAVESGLTVVYEQITPPIIGRIMREERQLFSGIEPQDPDEIVEGGIERDIDVFKLAHAVVCPSTFVQQQVTALTDSHARTFLTPYGLSSEWLDGPRFPIRGRVLFVGTVGLGKGNHYLAEAARLLKARRVECEFRVVGPHDPRLIARPEFQGPTYVGQVPRDAVRDEFARADVFALPTLAEGLAMAHLEALACGVPVITTPNCGSQVRDGLEGFIVPIRDAKALADRIEQLITDRQLRESMSHAARARARELSWSHFGQLLLGATRQAMRVAAAAK